MKECLHCHALFVASPPGKKYCTTRCTERAADQRSRKRPGSRRWIRDRERKASHIARNRDFVYQDKISKGCSNIDPVCLERRPNCLDYHHRERATKDSDISSMVRTGVSFKRLQEEMSKCDILCRNCHAVLELGDGYR